MLYLSIHEGDDPDHTVPVFGSTDPAVIRGVLEVLARRLGVLDAFPAARRTGGCAIRDIDGPMHK